MNNWFENNPTKSVIVHTILVAATVWAFFIFVFDENKVNFYEAKVSKIEAASKEVYARNEVLTTRLEFITEENKKLRSWLEDTPSTVPHYEKEIEKLKSQLVSLKGVASVNTSIKSADLSKILYENSIHQEAATSFIDKKTNVVLGVEKINYGNSANINLTLPDGEKIKAKNVKAGETWNFKKNGTEYMLILNSIDWASGKYKSSVIELPKK
jgi:cell division protein FtsB